MIFKGKMFFLRYKKIAKTLVFEGGGGGGNGSELEEREQKDSIKKVLQHPDFLS